MSDNPYQKLIEEAIRKEIRNLEDVGDTASAYDLKIVLENSRKGSLANICRYIINTQPVNQ